MRVVAIRPAQDGNGVILSVQSAEGKASSASITWMGAALGLGKVPAGRIASWRLTSPGGQWTASPSSALE